MSIWFTTSVWSEKGCLPKEGFAKLQYSDTNILRKIYTFAFNWVYNILMPMNTIRSDTAALPVSPFFKYQQETRQKTVWIHPPSGDVTAIVWLMGSLSVPETPRLTSRWAHCSFITDSSFSGSRGNFLLFGPSPPVPPVRILFQRRKILHFTPIARPVLDVR